MNYSVVIPAAGQGKRMGAGENKLFLSLRDVPIIAHTLNIFQKDPECLEIILAVHPDDKERFRSLIKTHQYTKVSDLVNGGKTRQESVFNGLQGLHIEEGIVLIHDGARPFVTRRAVHAVAEAANIYDAAILAVPVKDTIKKVSHDQVVETIDRSSLWAVQTPQAFLLSHIINAHKIGQSMNSDATDDAALIEQIGKNVHVVHGDYTNIKITTPEDLVVGERFLNEREGG